MKVAKKLFKICYDFGNKMKEDNVNAYASSCAFFVFLSLVPMVIFVLAIIPYTPLSQDTLANWLVEEMPVGTGSLLSSFLNQVYDRSFSVLIITAITTLWSAGKGVNALITGFNAVDRNFDKRNMIVLRLLSSLYTLIFLLSIVVILVMMVYGNVATNMLLSHFPILSRYFGYLVNFRTIISIALMTVIFVIAYAVLPYKKHKMKEQIPGALFSSIAWTLFSYFFSLYVENFDAFSMYGSLTTIIVLMFWLYVCMYIVLIGANLNRYFLPVIQVLLPSNIAEIRARSQNK